MRLGIVGPGYIGRSSNINASQTINFFAEMEGNDSKSVVALIGTPGNLLFTDTNLGVIRGAHAFNNLMYVVAREKLYSITSAGVVSAQLGSDLSTFSGRVQMVDNGVSPTGGDQLAIVDGACLYIWNVKTSTFTTVSFGVDIVTPYTICFLGGHFIIDDGQGGRWRSSDLYDGTVWNALDVSTADSAPDDLLSVYNNHGELWFIGQYTTEVWQQDPSATPPFSRQGAGVIDYGTPARYSIAKGNNTLFLLVNKRDNDQGEFAGVGMLSGYGIQFISTPSLDYTFSRYSVINDAFGYCFVNEGHEFYRLTFPTANATWDYDITTGLWNQVSSYKDSPYAIGRHIGNCYVFAWGKHFIGDYKSGKIYEMSSKYYTDNGDPIVSIRTASHLASSDDLNNVFVHKLQLDMETGVGDGSAPIYLPGGQLSATITVGVNPYAIAYDQTDFWVVNENISAFSGTLSRIDSSSNVVKATIDLGVGNPIAIAYAYNYIWVVNTDYKLQKIDPLTNSIISTSDLGYLPSSIIAGNGYIWVGTLGHVLKVDPATNTIIDGISLSTLRSVTAMAFDGTYIWTNSPGNFGIDAIKKIDVLTDTIVDSISVDSRQDIIYINNFIWVVGVNAIHKIDPATDTVVTTISVPGPQYFTYDGKYIWTTCTDNTIRRIDLDSHTYISIAVGTDPKGIAYSSDYIWVTNYSDNTVSKIKIKQESPSSNPQALLSWSDDGGHLWSNDHAASIGRQGEYRTRLIWWRLGYSQDRIFRVAISDSVKKVLLAENIEVTKGVS